MKKLVLFVLLLPALVWAQSGAFGHGGSSLDLSTLLPIIADSSWLKLDDADTVTTKAARDLKVPGLLVTGASKFEGEVTVRNNVTLSSSGVTELNADSVTADVGIRTGGGVKAADISVSSGGDVAVGAVRWDVAATDSINGAVVAARSIPDKAMPALSGDLSGTLGAAVVGDDSHNHTTAATKFVVADSQRVNKTSKLIGNVQVGTGTNWFTAADSLLAIEGEISLDGFKVSAIDTVFTATYVPRWVKYTSGAKSWYSPVYADTTGKW